MSRPAFFVIFVALLTTGRHTAPPTAQASLPPLVGPAALDDWGNRFASLGALVPENNLRTQVRTTIAQIAMFDAVNAVLDGPYRPFASKPPVSSGASPEAAAIRAAYVVARNEFPTRAADVESAYRTSIGRVIASSDAITRGIAAGEAAAYAVLVARLGDHRNDPDLDGYMPGNGPGVWMPTPPTFSNPQTPFLQFVTPFGYDDPTRFRPQAPPALDSRTYTRDYDESKAVAQLTAATRTAEQSDTAAFWSPSASALWSANIRRLAGNMDLLTAARFEAIGIAAVTNALIAAWDAKFTYMFWRPVTAIRAGDIDGNDRTDADPAWTPLLSTPPHPEYPAAHTTVGASALAFYTVWFGTDQFQPPLAFEGNKSAVRYYASVNEIRAEEGNARVWGGMHWRNSTEVGSAVGSKIGKYTATHLLKRLDDDR